MYADADHAYDVRIPDDEIRRRLVELENPHHDERVLRYLHFELEMSSRQIGELFGVRRQTIQKIVRQYGWEFHGKRGGSAAVGKDQHTLGDFTSTSAAELLGLERDS